MRFVWVDSARDHRDRAAKPRRPRKALVGGEKGTAQLLGERDVGSVVGRKVVPKLPDAVQDPKDWIPDHTKVAPHVQRGPAGVRPDLALATWRKKPVS
jgi:hypothetical protein